MLDWCKGTSLIEGYTWINLLRELFLSLGRHFTPQCPAVTQNGHQLSLVREELFHWAMPQTKYVYCMLSLYILANSRTNFYIWAFRFLVSTYVSKSLTTQYSQIHILSWKTNVHNSKISKMSSVQWSHGHYVIHF